MDTKDEGEIVRLEYSVAKPNRSAKGMIPNKLSGNTQPFRKKNQSNQHQTSSMPKGIVING
jgi:hypothetical protein